MDVLEIQQVEETLQTNCQGRNVCRTQGMTLFPQGMKASGTQSVPLQCYRVEMRTPEPP